MKLLPAERDDVRLEQGRAAAAPQRAARGHAVRLTAEGLRPEAAEGPVDLTIYAPSAASHAPLTGFGAPQPPPPHDGFFCDLVRGGGWPLPDAAPGSPRYDVAVEATLRVRGGRAGYTFRTVGEDAPGRYVAVFRRTDCSSRPVARIAFELS